MMPSEGMKGTWDGFLTGIKLHKKLLEVSPSIKKLNTFFITNLPLDGNTTSYYAMADHYAKEVGGLFRKGNPKEIANSIKATKKGSDIDEND
jgi:hypothetical protein